jgi:hypothetical protein
VRDVGIAGSDYEWMGKEIFIVCRLMPRVSTTNTTTKANAYMCKWKYKYFSVTQGTSRCIYWIYSAYSTASPWPGQTPKLSFQAGELDFTFASPPI